MPGMMPPTLLPGYGMGHGMERELGPQMHRSQSMPSGSYPPGGARRAPHVHSGGRFDRDSATRNAPPLLGWKTGRNDPTLMHNEVLKMRLGRDRSEMEPRQAEQFINHVQQRGRSAPLAAPATARLLCLARTRLAALWTARHSDEAAEPLGARPMELRPLERAASKAAADPTAFGHSGAAAGAGCRAAGGGAVPLGARTEQHGQY